MPAVNTNQTQKLKTLFDERRTSNFRQIDSLFGGLMLFQWLAGVALAFWISPRTWSGSESRIHLHVWAALFLGAAIISLPLWRIITRPGETLTRHLVAIGQMLTSGLLIHLSGGRIESHFHVFGSIAFLALYRDWPVLITATISTLPFRSHIPWGLATQGHLYDFCTPGPTSFRFCNKVLFLLCGDRRAW